MKSTLVAISLAAAALAVNQQQTRDWIDPDTGHRVVRLTDDAGGSTLYFHDNAFSPEGDKLMFNTPNGIAVVDVAKIGIADVMPQIVGRGRSGVLRTAQPRDLLRECRTPWR